MMTVAPDVCLGTVKAYRKIAHDARIVASPEYTRIAGVAGIPHKSAVHVD